MNQNKPKVTIITVTYNAEKYIEETINNIINQDYPNIEYIIIDGGSRDNTVDIIKKYNSYITYWISEPDKGIYDAMNKGINVATGDWINFMNAGDTFCEKNTISKVINEVTEKVDLISGDIYYIKNNNKEYLKAKGLENILNGMFCFHQTLFTRTQIMKEYHFNIEFKIAGDYDFVLKCYMNQYKFKFLNFAIANFIADGLAENNSIKARIEDMFIQSKYLNDEQDIFNLSAYARFESLKPNNNRILAKLINNLYLELDSLNLEEKKFILYGYGHIGKIIHDKYKHNILAIIDRNYEELTKIHSHEIYNITQLKDLNSEYILISVLGREKEIIQSLEKENLLLNKKVITLKI